MPGIWARFIYIDWNKWPTCVGYQNGLSLFSFVLFMWTHFHFCPWHEMSRVERGSGQTRALFRDAKNETAVGVGVIVSLHWCRPSMRCEGMHQALHNLVSNRGLLLAPTCEHSARKGRASFQSIPTYHAKARRVYRLALSCWQLELHV